MDENNTEMNGVGEEESAEKKSSFISELEKTVDLPEEENASGDDDSEAPKDKKSAVASVFDIVEMFSICAAVILLLFTFAVRLTVVDSHSCNACVEFCDRRDIAEVQLGVNALRVHIHSKSDYVNVTCTLAVAEKSSLDTVSTCEQTHFSIRYRAAAVVVRVE